MQQKISFKKSPKTQSPTQATETNPDLTLRWKLDLVEERAQKTGDCLLLKFVKVEREIFNLQDEENIRSVTFSEEKRQKLEDLEKELENIKRTIRFCDNFVNEHQAKEEQERARQFQAKARQLQSKEKEIKERQKRLTECGEITVNGEEKVIQVSSISQKTLKWLKTIMDNGFRKTGAWEDEYVFKICDQSWVTRAASEKTPTACLDLFWHLMQIDGIFPRKDVLTALSERTGTPSPAEIATILGCQVAAEWVRKTREYVMKRGVSELEFRAKLGDVVAQKALAEQKG